MNSYVKVGAKVVGAIAVGVALGAATVAAIQAAAQAAHTSTCKSVSVNLVDRNDNGSHGIWAKDTMVRTVKVCLGDEAGDKPTYYATVTDAGTFVTVDGKSPHNGVDLAAGIKGTVNGGFEVAKFTTDAEFKLVAPAASTSSPDWVAAAFSGSNATISTYKWVYKTTCESYTDNNGDYTGDITKKCVVPTTPAPQPKACEAYLYTGTRVNLCAAFPNPKGKVNCSDVKYRVTLLDAKNDPWGLDGNKGVKGVGCEANPLKVQATPSPSHSRSATAAPSRSAAAAGGLPVTGPKVATIAVAGGALLVAGVGLLVGLRRRTKFQA